MTKGLLIAENAEVVAAGVVVGVVKRVAEQRRAVVVVVVDIDVFAVEAG